MEVTEKTSDEKGLLILGCEFVQVGMRMGLIRFLFELYFNLFPPRLCF